jgi:hypothetical protein
VVHSREKVGADDVGGTNNVFGFAILSGGVLARHAKENFVGYKE